VRGLTVLVLCLAIATAALWPAAAQTPDPPCAPGVAPGAMIRASDLQNDGGPLTATHTIDLALVRPDDSEDQFKVTLPPGAEAVRGGPGPAFRVDTPGPVPITATWSEYVREPEGFCTASAATTLNIEPAKPLRYIAPRTRSGIIVGEWRVRIGENADLRPVQMRLRGVRRARLPGASAPVETVTFALRGGDKGLTYFGSALRTVRSAGWHFDATWAKRDELRIQMRDHSNRRGRAFGLELELTQAGRRLGRTRLVGRCNDLFCTPRVVR
jgi:hypothetical protein